ncbi:MAG: bifunctional pyr operon transcriptional regulator/uracil phosphoribosyltransferase PyrR [Planctomycetes bacterium]|nr:bifunctional pyr operon transcriptional regulator/uracil phosphoribosyltransferase PyrR [Planctomycetota bacterium]
MGCPPGGGAVRTLADEAATRLGVGRIVEWARAHALPGAALVGIQTGGARLAEAVASSLAAGGKTIPMGLLDITLYRDDLAMRLRQPVVRRTEMPFSVDGATILLLDDVLYTGRTLRAALGELHDLGRPARVLLGVLVDRGGRELPIQPDAFGIRCDVPSGERVEVDWSASAGPRILVTAEVPR